MGALLRTRFPAAQKFLGSETTGMPPLPFSETVQCRAGFQEEVDTWAKALSLPHQGLGLGLWELLLKLLLG